MSERFKTLFSRFRSLFSATIVLLALILIINPSEAQALVQPTVRTDTPHVLDGEVWDVEQFGTKVIVAGDFSQVRKQNSSLVYDQPNIFAYDINTGEFDTTFRPDVDNEIRDIEVANDGIYLAGKFTKIDGEWRERVAKLDSNLELDDWSVYGTNALVSTIATDGTWVYYGGKFTSTDGNSNISYLARATAANASVDSGYRFTWGQAIGRTYVDAQGVQHRSPGVSRVDTTEDGRVFISHRHLTVNGQQLAGLFQWDNGIVNGWTARQFDGTNLYTDESCNNGILPRDLEISPNEEYLVIVHQGHDLGYACDTAVKIALDGNGVMEWSSRLFDSIFSVGIDDDAIYIGGHFRWVVSPTAPSAFPGRTDNVAYNADPTSTTSEFYSDLVAPGYVQLREQIAALNPTTGKGLDWNPGTNTQIGVLGITVVDRGLLIGQHNTADRWDVVAGEITGRSAFFDNGQATAGLCSLEYLTAGNGAQLSWTDNGASSFNVIKNDSWLASVNGLSYSDALAKSSDTYTLRARTNGTVADHSCEATNSFPVTTGPFCTVEVLVGGGVRYEWQKNSATYYSIRKNNSWVTTINNPASSSYVHSGADGTELYQVRVIESGQKIDHTCLVDGDTADNGAQAVCKATVVGSRAILSWDDLDKSSYSVRKNGKWLATTSGTTYTDLNYSANDIYQLRYTLNGSKIDINCVVTNP